MDVLPDPNLNLNISPCICVGLAGTNPNCPYDLVHKYDLEAYIDYSTYVLGEIAPLTFIYAHAIPKSVPEAVGQPIADALEGDIIIHDNPVYNVHRRNIEEYLQFQGRGRLNLGQVNPEPIPEVIEEPAAEPAPENVAIPNDINQTIPWGDIGDSLGFERLECVNFDVQSPQLIPEESPAKTPANKTIYQNSGENINFPIFHEYMDLVEGNLEDPTSVASHGGPQGLLRGADFSPSAGLPEQETILPEDTVDQPLTSFHQLYNNQLFIQDIGPFVETEESLFSSGFLHQGHSTHHHGHLPVQFGIDNLDHCIGPEDEVALEPVTSPTGTTLVEPQNPQFGDYGMFEKHFGTLGIFPGMTGYPLSMDTNPIITVTDVEPEHRPTQPMQMATETDPTMLTIDREIGEFTQHFINKDLSVSTGLTPVSSVSSPVLNSSDSFPSIIMVEPSMPVVEPSMPVVPPSPAESIDSVELLPNRASSLSNLKFAPVPWGRTFRLQPAYTLNVSPVSLGSEGPTPLTSVSSIQPPPLSFKSPGDGDDEMTDVDNVDSDGWFTSEDDDDSDTATVRGSGSAERIEVESDDMDTTPAETDDEETREHPGPYFQIPADWNLSELESSHENIMERQQENLPYSQQTFGFIPAPSPSSAPSIPNHLANPPTRYVNPAQLQYSSRQTPGQAGTPSSVRDYMLDSRDSSLSPDSFATAKYCYNEFMHLFDVFDGQ